MRLSYLTVATIPYTTAHSKYVVQLCQGFASHISTTVVAAKKLGFRGSIQESNFRLLSLPVLHAKNTRVKSYQVVLWHAFYILWRKLVSKRDEEVFVVHNALSALLCALLNCRYIVDMHGKELGSDISRKIVSWHPPIFWVVQSDLLKSYLVDGLKVGADRIFLSRNAVNYISDTREVAGVEMSADQRNIAYIGRLVPEMGYGDLMAALETSAMMDRVQIHMAGDRNKHADYFNAISKQFPSGSTQVEFVGFLDETEIEWLSRNSDAFLLLYSSAFHFVGTLSPMKLFEYLKYEKPIIAPKIPDIQEVVQYYNCEDRMVWYEMDDAGSLAAAIRRVADGTIGAFNSVNVETWEDKAKNILDFMGDHSSFVAGGRA